MPHTAFGVAPSCEVSAHGCGSGVQSLPGHFLGVQGENERKEKKDETKEQVGQRQDKEDKKGEMKQHKTRVCIFSESSDAAQSQKLSKRGVKRTPSSDALDPLQGMQKNTQQFCFNIC